MKLFTLLLFLGATASAQFFGSSSSGNSAPEPKKLRQMNITTGIEFQHGGKPNEVVSLIVGERTHLNINLTNHEPKPVTVEYIGGSLWDVHKRLSMRNFTTVKLGKIVNTDVSLDIPYSFDVNLPEQVLWLNLQLIIRTSEDELLTVTAFNQTVSILDHPTSAFDPGMLFLYLILASGFTGVAYAAYSKWLASVSPPKRRGPRIERPPPVTPVASGIIDESWIPEGHLKKAKTTGAKKVSAAKTTKKSSRR